MKETERISSIFHEAWSAWCRYFLEGKHTPDDLHDWQKYMNLPYEELPDGWKDNNRFWANKVLKPDE